MKKIYLIMGDGLHSGSGFLAILLESYFEAQGKRFGVVKFPRTDSQDDLERQRLDGFRLSRIFEVPSLEDWDDGVCEDFLMMVGSDCAKQVVFEAPAKFVEICLDFMPVLLQGLIERQQCEFFIFLHITGNNLAVYHRWHSLWQQPLMKVFRVQNGFQGEGFKSDDMMRIERLSVPLLPSRYTQKLAEGSEWLEVFKSLPILKKMEYELFFKRLKRKNLI